MKKSEPRVLPSFLLGLVLTSAHLASAFTYSDSDLLLVTRKSGSSDVLFNLGSISNFFGRPIGSTTIISNYPSSLIQSNFGGDLSGVKYILLSATTPDDSPLRVWLTDAVVGGSPQDETLSKWTTQRSKVNAVGSRASSYPEAAPQAVIISSSDPNSYTYIASGGGTVDPSTLGGAAPFQVEQDLGSPMRLFELKVSSANPKPFAAEVGRFTLGTDGSLAFSAEFNRSPVATADGDATQVDQPLALSAGQLLANDTDPDGDILAVISVSTPSANDGSAILNAGSVTYTPAAGFKGVDSFNYTISDGHGANATAQVQILVTDGPIPAYNSVAIAPAPNGFTIRFAGIAGRSYQIL